MVKMVKVTYIYIVLHFYTNYLSFCIEGNKQYIKLVRENWYTVRYMKS